MGFPIPVFKTGALVRSAIPPFRRILTYIWIEDKHALKPFVLCKLLALNM